MEAHYPVKVGDLCERDWTSRRTGRPWKSRLPSWAWWWQCKSRTGSGAP